MLLLLRYAVYKEFWPTRLTAHLTGYRERWTAAQITLGGVLRHAESPPDREVSGQTDSSQLPPDSALPHTPTSPSLHSAGQSVSGHAGGQLAVVTLQHDHTGTHLPGQCMDIGSSSEFPRGIGVSQGIQGSHLIGAVLQ